MDEVEQVLKQRIQKPKKVKPGYKKKLEQERIRMKHRLKRSQKSSGGKKR